MKKVYNLDMNQRYPFTVSALSGTNINPIHTTGLNFSNTYIFLTIANKIYRL